MKFKYVKEIPLVKPECIISRSFKLSLEMQGLRVRGCCRNRSSLKRKSNFRCELVILECNS